METVKKIVVFVSVLLCSAPLFSQIKISAEFDSGSLGGYALSDSVWVQRSVGDSVQVLTIGVQSRTDPDNPVDTTIAPSSRWYHFRLEGVKDKLVLLRVENSEMIRPFYSYDGRDYRRFDASENVFPDAVNKIFLRDTVYIAHFLPYTYTRQAEKIAEWAESPFVKREVIGHSGGNLPIDMLTITDGRIPDADKKRVWMHARVHTSEAPSSWHLEGMIDELLSDMPFARELRRNTVFYIVPQTNPDGVRGGYSRSTATGVNLEVNWNRPDSLTEPEVRALKTAMTRLTADKPFDVMLNLHSQIAGSITYWIHTPESTSLDMYRRKMLLSALTIDHSPYYRPEDQLFSTIAAKYPEGWLWNRFGDRTLAVTFETPYIYYNADPDGTWVSQENLSELAHSSLLALSDLLNLDRKSRLLADAENLKYNRRWSFIGGTQELFFGNAYLAAGKEGAAVKFVFPDAEKGEYELYKWSVGPLAPTYSPDVNRWEKIGELTQRKNGRLVWKYKATGAEDKLDAVLLVKKS